MTTSRANCAKLAPIFGAFFLAVFGLSTSMAAANLQRLCDDAAARAAFETQVPLSVLQAITRTETGRSLDGVVVPWPWTVNMDGQGTWFEDKNSAQAYVFRHFKNGVRSFDVGCFQANYTRDGWAFFSIDEMFEPLANARYAAHLLGELYQEFGDWSVVTAAYHARAQKYADRNHARFDQVRNAQHRNSNDSPTRRTSGHIVNTSPPLTERNEDWPNGSLVPVQPSQMEIPPTTLFAGG